MDWENMDGKSQVLSGSMNRDQHSIFSRCRVSKKLVVIHYSGNFGCGFHGARYVVWPSRRTQHQSAVTALWPRMLLKGRSFAIISVGTL